MDDDTKTLCANVLSDNVTICATPMVEVPFFNQVELVCPRCHPERMPSDPKAKADQLLRRRLGFEEKKRNPPPEPGDQASNGGIGGMYGTVIDSNDFHDPA